MQKAGTPNLTNFLKISKRFCNDIIPNMGQVITVSKLPSFIKNIKKQKKSICLVGGCFDILHPGHVVFLQKAKTTADTLIVLLESDEKVKKLKGTNRPVHTQNGRAMVLSALSCVDMVVMLPYMSEAKEYDAVIRKLAPQVIATTFGDPDSQNKKRSANLTGAKLKFVTRVVGNHSSTAILTNRAE